MSHDTRIALAYLHASPDTLDALAEISEMFSPSATLAHDDLDGIDFDALGIDLDVGAL